MSPAAPQRRSLTIAFHSNQLSLRGTEVALYDYAAGAQEQLGHRSVVLHDARSPHNDPQALEKFRARFDVLAYQDRSELDGLLGHCGADLLYAIKAGKRDGLLSATVPTMVHAVFPTHPKQAHGASYAYISEWLSTQCSGGRIPSVPHIVSLPDVPGNLRAELGIPSGALVLGCHGGAQSFDVPPAQQAVRALLQRRDDIWFVFLNIAPFVQHPHALFLPGTGDGERKTRFVNTCDAMLHARRQGESFGLACGEFSIRNKPVFTWARSKHRHHIEVLGPAARLYDSAEDLAAQIETLQRDTLAAGQWDRYSERYNPAAVMALFDRHLIQPALANPSRLRPALDIGWRQSLRFYRLKLAMRLGTG